MPCLRGYGQQRLDRLHVRCDQAASFVGRAGHDNRRCIQASHPVQGIRLDCGSRSQDDLAGPAPDTRLGAQLMNLGCRRLLRQHHEVELLGIVLFQKTAHPATGAQQLGEQREGLAGPAQHHHMILQRNRRKASLKIRHFSDQPPCQDRHQSAHEHHIAANSQQGRNKALPGANVVTQVTWIGQPKKRPPDCRARIFEVAALGNHKQATD